MNPDDASKLGDRRAFLRNVAMGGLVAVTGALLARRREGQCLRAGICRGCAAYEDCALPAALSARQALASQSRGTT